MQFKRSRAATSRSAKRSRSLVWRQIFIGVSLALILALMGTAIWYGTRVTALTLSDIEISGGETISHADVREVVETELQGTYYRLIPHRFAWLYPAEKIQSQLQQIPRIHEVQVIRTSGTQLSITFTEYVPYALWCASIDATDCLFIDDSGFAFGTAPPLTGGAFLRYIAARETVQPGESPFSPSFIERTADFVTTVSEQFGFNITAVEETGFNELAYQVAGGGVIRTSLDIPLDDTVKNLATILESNQFSHLRPGNFQYIDLRFGNKVFVNEVVAPTPEGEGATTTSQIIE